ncbi:MAG: phosphopantothenoylcysteine decarboxylase [Firmicutes bacterium]|nr:phosphopantothenoylcysteine decarboxylase [Bacillota bacterium]
MKHVILGVTGSIAAYKAADLANTLTKQGVSVHTIMTESACRLITPLTFQTLTKNKVHTDMFDEYQPSEVQHISLAKQADLMLVAPATANFIAKAAAGIADDMLTTVLTAFINKPVIICPAMNTNMYLNPVTQRNMETLKDLGFTFVEPREAMLACGDLGKGALAANEIILSAVYEFLK